MNRGSAAALVSTVLVAVSLAIGISPAAATFDCAPPEVVTEVPSDGINATSPFVITTDGSRVLMASNEDPLGENADGGDDLFVYDRILDRLTQRTHLAAGADIPSNGFGMDDDGSSIAFTSNTNPVGNNADGNYELFTIGSSAFDPFGSLQLVQLTNTNGGTHVPSVSVSEDGVDVAFTSDRNLDTSNADLGNELYLAVVSSFPSVTFEQLGTNGASNPTMAEVDISGDGSEVVFLTNVATRGGVSNADGSTEVVRTTIAAEPSVPITALPAGNG